MTSLRDPSVAVIGGGIAGLVCAIRLGQLGIQNVKVFDTGKRASGGRCSSRSVNINGQIHVFDHSSQYFTVSDPRFANIVSFLHSKNAIKIWNGTIGHLKTGYFEVDQNLTQAFIGINGMQSIAECLSLHTNVHRPVWVSEVSWNTQNKKWRVDRFGFFDYLIIAHNGKCADKLMSSASVPNVHNLLRVRFNDTINPRDQRMHLCSLWVLLVAFPSPLKLGFEGAHVYSEDISWVGNNTAKLKNTQISPKCGTECWTIISTKQFGKQFKVPQENIPPQIEKAVINKLLSAFRLATGLKDHMPSPCFTKVQLWGAAVPINVLDKKTEYVFDCQVNLGVCGDWLVSPSIQGAALSGLSLAEKIHKHALGQDQESTDLRPNFKPSCAKDIGAFPVDKSLIFSPKK